MITLTKEEHEQLWQYRRALVNNLTFKPGEFRHFEELTKKERLEKWPR